MSMHNCSGRFKAHFLEGSEFPAADITVCTMCLHCESFHHYFVSVQGLHWNGDTLIIKLTQFNGRYVPFLTRLYIFKINHCFLPNDIENVLVI